MSWVKWRIRLARTPATKLKWRIRAISQADYSRVTTRDLSRLTMTCRVPSALDFISNINKSARSVMTETEWVVGWSNNPLSDYTLNDWLMGSSGEATYMTLNQVLDAVVTAGTQWLVFGDVVRDNIKRNIDMDLTEIVRMFEALNEITNQRR